LQICGAGGKSRKSPTLVVGKKPYWKSQISLIGRLQIHYFMRISSAICILAVCLWSSTASAQTTLVNGVFGNEGFGYVPSIVVPSGQAQLNVVVQNLVGTYFQSGGGGARLQTFR
jgi:hypothetical protein